MSINQTYSLFYLFFVNETAVKAHF